MTLITELADVLEAARRDGVAIGPITAGHPELTLAQGYEIQDELSRRREIGRAHV